MQGGSEAIRQNGIFKDFYSLAEHQIDKKKYLYVVGTELPLKFFNGGRALTSVLSRYQSILDDIHNKYGTGIIKVRDYYALRKNDVIICDISQYLR